MCVSCTNLTAQNLPKPLAWELARKRARTHPLPPSAGLQRHMLPALSFILAAGECARYCATNDKPWDQKCTWNECRSCPSDCPELPPALCRSYCASNTNIWAKKCTWNGCGGCTNFRFVKGTADCASVLNAVPEDACKPSCIRNTNEWAQKCKWAGCRECSPSCSAPPSLPPPAPPAAPPQLPCLNYCIQNTRPWEQKCRFRTCAGCHACSMAPPPLLPLPSPAPAVAPLVKYWVSGGEFGDPYYNFNPPLQPFEPGKTYAFKGGERTSRDGRHPFALGSEPFVDLPLEFNLVGTSVLTLGEWTQITIPEDYTGQIFYYCTAHSSMAKAFEISPS